MARWISQYTLPAGDFLRHEQGYSTTEREALGMVFSVQKFRHYLLGKLFHFYVDHQALLYLINKVLIQGRLMRWMLFLQEYEFKIFHKPGKHHHGADFLSRAVLKVNRRSQLEMSQWMLNCFKWNAYMMKILSGWKSGHSF